jgi:hypothetical protein
LSELAGQKSEKSDIGATSCNLFERKFQINAGEKNNKVGGESIIQDMPVFLILILW